MSRLALFPDAWVMLAPGSAYPPLTQTAARGGWWLMLRRPLLVACVLGCAMSLMTSGRVTLRLAVPATIYWSFVPLFEIAALAAVGTIKRGGFSRTVDLFFMSHAPWSLGLVGYAAMWAFVPAVHIFTWTTSVWYLPGLAVAAWSGYIDFCFYRSVIGSSLFQAIRGLLLQRLICWTGVAAVFLASAGWQVVAARLGL